MTAKQRRVAHLTRQAEAHGLRLEHREPCAGKWVWDVRDVARGTLAVRGVNLQQVAEYLGVQA
ncbi:MAG: hypothetical protein M3P44_11755 [Actinomycetota bacterium]|nr:hypothetical protein [Actinomycetota bacterium]